MVIRCLGSVYQYVADFFSNNLKKNAKSFVYSKKCATFALAFGGKLFREIRMERW